ncbi:hypothetical protein HPB50_017389 [Hyalomma asiaticum]|uniref:Uncharacterized protein n=1 Tax=Hyalomma asiaticum TaxID=266040 RepID=A0ACB7SRN9_HYAAI|nr:hypothetical protein HPB50_017389 [Hyalomma asiaticum]
MPPKRSYTVSSHSKAHKRARGDDARQQRRRHEPAASSPPPGSGRPYPQEDPPPSPTSTTEIVPASLPSDDDDNTTVSWDHGEDSDAYHLSTDQDEIEIMSPFSSQRGNHGCERFSRTFTLDLPYTPAFRPRNQAKACGIVSGDIVVGLRTRIGDATRPPRPLSRHLSTSQRHVTADCGATPRRSARAPASPSGWAPAEWGPPLELGERPVSGSRAQRTARGKGQRGETKCPADNFRENLEPFLRDPLDRDTMLPEASRLLIFGGRTPSVCHRDVLGKWCSRPDVAGRRDVHLVLECPPAPSSSYG